jgi:hypothetical protein
VGRTKQASVSASPLASLVVSCRPFLQVPGTLIQVVAKLRSCTPRSRERGHKPDSTGIEIDAEMIIPGSRGACEPCVRRVGTGRARERTHYKDVYARASTSGPRVAVAAHPSVTAGTHAARGQRHRAHNLHATVVELSTDVPSLLCRNVWPLIETCGCWHCIRTTGPAKHRNDSTTHRSRSQRW